MPHFALTLPPALRHGLLGVVEGTFVAFVVISFLVVATYTARQISRRGLLAPQDAPLPVAFHPALSAWFLIACTLGLIFLQSVFYPLVVMVGIGAVLIQNRRPAEIQFGFNRLPIIRAQAYALLVFGAVMLVESPLSSASDGLFDFFRLPHPEQDSVESFLQLNDPKLIAWFIFQAVIFSPIVEELFFRGFLLSFLKNYTSPVLAIVLSGGVFACAHLNLGAFIPLWFLGIVLGVAYEHTGSLLVPMTIHGCFNLANALGLLLDKGNGS
jgi:membrane protease YdiL (CAAX protease family)